MCETVFVLRLALSWLREGGVSTSGPEEPHLSAESRTKPLPFSASLTWRVVYTDDKSLHHTDKLLKELPSLRRKHALTCRVKVKLRSYFLCDFIFPLTAI